MPPTNTDYTVVAEERVGEEIVTEGEVPNWKNITASHYMTEFSRQRIQQTLHLNFGSNVKFPLVGELYWVTVEAIADVSTDGAVMTFDSVTGLDARIVGLETLKFLARGLDSIADRATRASVHYLWTVLVRRVSAFAPITFFVDLFWDADRDINSFNGGLHGVLTSWLPVFGIPYDPPLPEPPEGVHSSPDSLANSQEWDIT